MFVRASNKNQVFLKADVEAFRGVKSEESVKTGQNESEEREERGGIKALLGGDMVTMDAELGYEMIEAFKDETTQKEGVYSFGAEADAGGPAGAKEARPVKSGSADDASFLLMNAYAARVSGAAMSGLLAQELQGRGGVIDWGELSLVEEKGDRQIGLSFFARWSSEG